MTNLRNVGLEELEELEQQLKGIGLQAELAPKEDGVEQLEQRLGKIDLDGVNEEVSDLLGTMSMK